MKQMIIMLLVSGAIWVGAPFQAQSQTSKKIFIGKTQELIEHLSGSKNLNPARKSAPKIAIKIDEKTILNASVNSSKISKGSNCFSGAIDSKTNSSFFMNIYDTKVDGHIILKEEKIAYRFFSDAEGNVFVSSVDINDVLCVDFPELPLEKKALSSPRSAELLANTNVYALQSLPGSLFVAYMDFDGEYLPATSWNSGNPLNAEPSGMSDAAILEAWEIVSEDFKPFNINITTDVTIFNNAAIGKRIRCIITPTNTAYPGSGGVAYIGSFTSASDEPCWSFTTGVGTGGKNIGEVASHEIGHTVGLYHDGRITPFESYYGGAGDWAPIMGVGYYRNMVTWSKGEYAHASNSQDDIAVITTQNGFGFRNDDHGNSNSQATALITGVKGLVSVTQNIGIIEQRNDVDVFSFTSTGGILDLFFNPSLRHANLDIMVRLYNQSNTLITSIDPSGSGAALNLPIEAGTYYIHVDGTGSGNPLTDGYSDYSSLGFYFISGSIPDNGENIPPAVSIINPHSNASFTAPATIGLEAFASDSDGSIVNVEFFRDTIKLGEDQVAPYTFVWNSVETGVYDLIVKATDDLGAITVSSVVSVSVNNSSTCNGISLWSSSQIYHPAGQKVSYQGDTFENKWWTQNEKPDKNDQWGVWKYIGPCKTGNQLPTIVITGPGNNSIYSAPTTVIISVAASDADGSISKVEFYKNNEKIGEDVMQPFVYSWNNVGAGSYVLTSKAIDNLGATGVSSPITITVTGNEVCDDVPQYTEYGGYISGSNVQNEGHRFECKPWPYSGWCNSAAWAYAPGTGLYWQDAWTDQGSCASAATVGNNSATVSSITVSPNPAADFIEIDLKTSGYTSATVSVYDVLGNRVISTVQIQNKQSLNLSELPAGIYYLQIMEGSEIIRHRIVKR